MATQKTTARNGRKPHVAEVQDGLCRISRAAEYLSVSRRTVERLVRDGLLDSVKVGRTRGIKWPSLHKYAGFRD